MDKIERTLKKTYDGFMLTRRGNGHVRAFIKMTYFGAVLQLDMFICLAKSYGHVWEDRTRLQGLGGWWERIDTFLSVTYGN